MRFYSIGAMSNDPRARVTYRQAQRFRNRLIWVTVLVCLVLGGYRKLHGADPAYVASLAVLNTLGAVDAHQTYSCLSAGKCLELSPFYRQFSPSGIVAAKAASMTALNVALLALHKRHPKVGWIMTSALIGAQAIVVLNNHMAVRR